MPGISQPFPNIFDPLNLLGNTGASNTKIRYILSCVEQLSMDSSAHRAGARRCLRIALA